MLNRIIGIIIFLASIAWVIFMGFETAINSNNFSPEYLFNSDDTELLIITRPNEVQINQVSIFEQAPAFELVDDINDSIVSEIFLSLERNHFLLYKNTGWTKDDLKQLFKTIKPIEITSSTFKIGKYSGRYRKNKLYIWMGEINHSESPIDFVFDKKASASIIKFGSSNNIEQYTDIYFQDAGILEYLTHNTSIENGKQVKDEEIFGELITKNFSRYHFLERSYYATKDSIFAESPMFQWSLNGFVVIEYNNQIAIISDYIEGQDPILVLNDLTQTSDTNKFNIPLIANFPKDKGTYYIKYLEDVVVISENLAIIDKIIADYKLGNTIALSDRAKNTLFARLPESVSERFVTSERSYSKAVYEGKILETKIGDEVFEDEITIQEPISISCNFEIQDFIVLKGIGNVVALSKLGDVNFYENEKVIKSLQIKGKIIGSLQKIDLHYSGEDFILLNTEDEIHLWNLNGEYQRGFPIKLENEATNSVKFYRWKSKSYFLIATESNEIIHFDAQGRELNIFNTNHSVTHQIDVWASQKKLFAGFSNNEHFTMFSMEKLKNYRDFSILPSSYASKVSNELYQFSIEVNALIRYDQKGVKTKFGNYDRPKILKVENNDRNPVIVLQSANEVHLLNFEGVPFAEIKLPFNEIDDIFIEKTESGETIIAIIDGLENNVYFYGTNGDRILNKLLEGKTKVVINFSGKTKQITTIVDQFIVQYFEN